MKEGTFQGHPSGTSEDEVTWSSKVGTQKEVAPERGGGCQGADTY